LIDEDAYLKVKRYIEIGKEEARVYTTLDHSTGVPHVRGPIPAGGFYDYDYMVGRVAAEPAFWVPGTRGGYHAITMAWTVGECVHRAGGQGAGRVEVVFDHD